MTRESTPGWSGIRTTTSEQGLGDYVLVLEQFLSVRGGTDDRVGDGALVSLLEKQGELYKLRGDRAQGLRERGPILEKDIAPDGGVGAGDSGEVLETGPDTVQRSLAPYLERPGVVHEYIGQHVRKVADHRHDPVVSHRVDVCGPCTQLHDELLQHLVELRKGRSGGAEEVGGLVEQVGPRVPHSRVGCAAHRMSSDEERACKGRQAAHDGRLGAAHVGDKPGCGLSRGALLHQRRDAPHGCGHHHEVGVGCGLGGTGRRFVDDASGQRQFQGLGIGVVADHLIDVGSAPGPREPGFRPSCPRRPRRAGECRYADGYRPPTLPQGLAGPVDDLLDALCHPLELTRIERLGTVG